MSVSFWRPTILVLLVLAAAVVTAELAGRWLLSVPPTPIERLAQPSPELAPREVVQIQLTALRTPSDPLCILQCMNFASPANLQVTGPVERFARMLQQEKYKVFGQASQTLLGRPQRFGRRARVLVTLIDGAGRPQAMVWVLCKQDGGPHRDCWMTDSVLPIDVDGAGPVVEPSSQAPRRDLI